ncbi:MazG nucleotide pyrophosphohydrolase domain-containing protein [Streptococcus porcinus]|uniref:Nucleotide pyrophosphohydrolase n=1 Tax=Streptococcus porcinus TaxID=1340 RepID=A0A7V9WRW2_STRPO|nr:MazG nucleotide pyrophosphohydrolase domain-containing protein [Streptococcus porcinus]MBA2795713.1 nucleotide pyrophosphohydrolase [Streptococcus porcinus]
MTNLTFKNYTEYLSEVYLNHKGDMRLFLKLIEEIGEVAEVMHAGSKRNKKELGNELADVIHYTLAIASINGIDIETVILNKDRDASLKYGRENNLTNYINLHKDDIS